MKKYIGWIIVIAGIIVDQVSKIFAQKITSDNAIIDGFLKFSNVQNYGSAFGVFKNVNGILAVVSAIICIGIIIYLFYAEKKELNVSLGVYLILSGGIGNLIDRAVRGYVIDFINTPFIDTFNVADSLIVIGCIWIIAEELCRSIFFSKKDNN